MEYSVKLHKLPDGVSFPARLKDRISLDPAQARLIYRGFMTKCTYDELAKLSDDADYRRALEQLFVLTSAEMSDRPKTGSFYPRIIMGVAASAVLIVLVMFWALTHRASSAKGNVPAVVTPVSAVSR
jgi:hypothetical protein